MKVCTKCGCEKEAQEFCTDRVKKDGLKSACRVCAQKAYAAWYYANQPRSIQRVIQYRDENLEKVKLREQEYRRNNPEKTKAATMNWRAKNAEHLRAYTRAYLKVRRVNDPCYQAACRLRGRFREFLNGNPKPGKTFEVLGYTRSELKKHIESTFKPGMAWDRPESFHIDHIKPLSLFDPRDPEQVKLAFALENLQALTPLENMTKSDYYEPTV